MKKTVMTVIAVTVIGIGGTFLGESAHADQIQDIKEERASIKDDLSAAESKIADVLLDLEELNDKIERAESALKENEAKMEETEADIEEKEEEIEELENEIAELEESIAKRHQILKDRVSAYQKNGGDVSYLEVIFGAESFSDFISRISAITKITDSDVKIIEQQEKDKAQIVKKQEEVENKLADLEEVKTELKGMQSIILEQKEANEERKSELRKKEKKLRTMKKDLEIEDDKLASLEAEVKRNMEREETAKGDSSSSQASVDAGSSDVEVRGSGDINTAINAGKRFIGNSVYSLGAMDPENGRFDCSGFVSWAYGQAGYSLPRDTGGLANVGTSVSKGDLQPGDLVFFNTYKTNGHVGIYLGDGKFIGSQSSTGVGIADMNDSYWKSKYNKAQRIN